MFLPNFHVFGIVANFWTLFQKSNLVIFAKFELQTYLAAIEKYKVGV